ncbi:Dabb family protein [Cryobacterium melibiosiphilum]|uniref:Dabb family protein n=1 Tax=Cryobacterium melibiosiphilum TaxID=995039 RepID=A0A3A5MIX2_9MICO|nr:Dabb family protein [Cryobacterium melibiosiphilum]RJT90110.1 Dabb family protein [Cryobacterium melibiosiphilum]
MTIRHIVCWKLSAVTPRKKAADAAEITSGLEALVGVVPEILALTVGPDVAGDENWDVALIADFDDLEALARYQKHPEHKKVGAFIRTVVSDRLAVDLQVA